jgi:hypothetical protein
MYRVRSPVAVRHPMVLGIQQHSVGCHVKTCGLVIFFEGEGGEELHRVAALAW